MTSHMHSITKKLDTLHNLHSIWIWQKHSLLTFINYVQYILNALPVFKIPKNCNIYQCELVFTNFIS